MLALSCRVSQFRFIAWDRLLAYTIVKPVENAVCGARFRDTLNECVGVTKI
jgi:hypothetical protein